MSNNKFEKLSRDDEKKTRTVVGNDQFTVDQLEKEIKKNLKGLNKYIKPRILFFGDSVSSDGAFLRDEAICLRANGRPKRVFGFDELAMRGEHNLKNYMASTLMMRKH